MSSDESATSFDYVIVGAGSAGCVLASRLSEDPNVTVAIIEAGPPDKHPWIHIPAGYFRTMFDPAITWQFESGPEPHMNNRMVAWPRGRVLGGSSSINGLLYVRGQRQDYDLWRQMGNTGWSYDDVLPYFRRAEDQERGESELHGEGGPLGVSDVKWTGNKLLEAYMDSCVAEGIPRTDDFNGEAQEGVGYYQLTNKGGRRCSTARGYLDPVRNRSNLHIITDAMALGLVLDGKRVTGIKLATAAGEEIISARREVLLAAGAIGSPQLLQVSGIGPGRVLRDAGVEVRHEMAGVGEALQDHIQVRFIYDCTIKGESINEIWHSKLRQLTTGLEYLATRGGPLTIGAGVVGVFTRSREGLEVPDIQFHVMPLAVERPGNNMYKFAGFTASVCQLRPESRGTLRITSPDPTAKPSIIANYLAASEDRRVTLDGMKLMRRIAARQPFAGLVKREFAPGPEAASDEALMEVARSTGTTVFHPTSTCRMGSDSTAVVDQRLRVKGLEGLRIVDASVMPALVSGNTNAPTIMIAEKASDMIKADSKAPVS